MQDVERRDVPSRTAGTTAVPAVAVAVDATAEAAAAAAAAAQRRERAVRLAGRASGPFLDRVRTGPRTLDPGQSAAAERLAAARGAGVFLWGDVGRGKTMLADLWLAAVPAERVRRFHVHAFLRELHAAIWAEGCSLDAAVDRLVGDAEALLFDEFHAHDLADAVYLDRLLTHVIDRGVLVLATSNHAPDGFLPDPGIHERAAPTIERIERELEVVRIGDGPDHRRDADAHAAGGFAAGRWIVEPAADGDDAEAPGGDAVDGDAPAGAELALGAHAIRAAVSDGGVVATTFAELCRRPLGTHEYLELAAAARRVEVRGVPPFARMDGEAAQRFANLVDVLVDRDVETVVIAAEPPDGLVRAEVPPRDVERTLSRLALLARG